MSPDVDRRRCALCAPLLIGTDLLRASADTLAILGNADLIALNQDPLGFQGVRSHYGGSH